MTSNPFDDDTTSSPSSSGKALDVSASADSAAAEKAPAEKPKPAAKKPQQKKAKKVDFDKAVSDKGVLSATSGQVTATVDMNQVAVPVLRVSMVGWVGTAPLELTASSIDDIRKVLDELEKQAS